MPQTVVKIAGGLVAALYVLALVVALVFGLPFSGWRALSVQTGSMVPAIRPGALVLVQSAAATDLRVGDVVTYRLVSRPATTITHRIIRIEDRGSYYVVTVKGDANAAPDPPILATQIVGRVAASIPHAGRLIDAFHSLPGLFLLVYLPAAAIIVYELRLLVRRMTALELAKRDEETEHWRPMHIEFKPTKYFYTLRDGMHSRSVWRRLHSLLLPAVLVFMMAGVGVTLAQVQTQARLTGNTIQAQRGHGHSDNGSDKEENDETGQPDAPGGVRSETLTDSGSSNHNDTATHIAASD